MARVSAHYANISKSEGVNIGNGSLAKCWNILVPRVVVILWLKHVDHKSWLYKLANKNVGRDTK